MRPTTIVLITLVAIAALIVFRPEPVVYADKLDISTLNYIEVREDIAVTVEVVEKIKEVSPPIKIGGTPEQQEIIDYAWSISNDPDWILTLNTESGNWTVDRIGGLNNGYIGLCQMSMYYHREFISAPEFYDYRHQLLYCAELYSRAMEEGRIDIIFQGYTDRWKSVSNFTW